MTGIVSLREVEESDLPVLFEHQMDPDAIRMAAFPPRDAEAFAAHWKKVLADETSVKMTILFDGQVAGNLQSWEHSGTHLIGYWLGKPYWGRGIATRALAAFLDHVPARPLHAHVAKHNIASLRVLQKCGFTVVGENKAAAATGGEAVEEWLLQLGASTSPSPAGRM
jgi:RimJ/RimL family protein N-acetyltransferase